MGPSVMMATALRAVESTHRKLANSDVHPRLVGDGLDGADHR